SLAARQSVAPQGGPADAYPFDASRRRGVSARTAAFCGAATSRSVIGLQHPPGGVMWSLVVAAAAIRFLLTDALLGLDAPLDAASRGLGGAALLGADERALDQRAELLPAVLEVSRLVALSLARQEEPALRVELARGELPEPLVRVFRHALDEREVHAQLYLRGDLVDVLTSW